MKMNFTVLTFIVGVLTTANAVIIRKNIIKIECTDVRRFEWTHAGLLNICFIKGDLSHVNQDSVVSNGFEDTNIEALGFQAQSKLNYIPEGLKDHYPNLVGLYFDETPLKVLTEENMKQFGSDLIHFHVSKSLITHLSKNLFANNPKLKFLSLSDNPLKYIEPGFFDVVLKMDNMLLFDMRDCQCINKQSEGDEIKNFDWSHSCDNS